MVKFLDFPSFYFVKHRTLKVYDITPNSSRDTLATAASYTSDLFLIVLLCTIGHRPIKLTTLFPIDISIVKIDKYKGFDELISRYSIAFRKYEENVLVTFKYIFNYNVLT